MLFRIRLISAFPLEKDYSEEKLFPGATFGTPVFIEPGRFLRHGRIYPDATEGLQRPYATPHELILIKPPTAGLAMQGMLSVSITVFL